MVKETKKKSKKVDSTKIINEESIAVAQDEEQFNLEGITKILSDLKNEINSNAQSRNDIYITAFYDALISGKTIDEIEKDKLTSIAKEIMKLIKERIKNSTDWNLREILKADMKLMIKTTLMRSGLQVDPNNIELVIDQAVKFDSEKPSWISA